MQRYILLALLLFCCCNANAQFDLGFQASGVSSFFMRKPFAPQESSDWGYTTSGSTKPVVSVYGITNIGKRFNAGLTIAYVQYFMLYETNSIGLYSTDDKYYQKSHFLYISPLIDLSLNKKKNFHLQVVPSVGFLLSGSEYGSNYFSGSSWNNTPSSYQEFQVPGKSIKSINGRIGIVLKKQFPIHTIAITAATGLNIGHELSATGYFHPGVFTFQAGIERRYCPNKSKPNKI